jgi:hypothetical protein
MSRLHLDQDERQLVAIRRAAVAYAAERGRFDPTLDTPRGDELVYLELHLDGSGRLRVEPVDGEAFTAASWEGEEGAEKIASATLALVQERDDRQAGRKVGDPRRGRRRVFEDCDGGVVDVG